MHGNKGMRKHALFDVPASLLQKHYCPRQTRILRKYFFNENGDPASTMTIRLLKVINRKFCR